MLNVMTIASLAIGLFGRHDRAHDSMVLLPEPRCVGMQPLFVCLSFALPWATLSSLSCRQAGTGSTVVRKAIPALLCAFAVLALLTPVPAMIGRWKLDVKAALSAVTQPDAARADLAWKVGSPYPSGDDLANRLLDFYSLPPNGGSRTMVPLSRDQACSRLRMSPAPAVLSRTSQREVSAEFSCVRFVRTIAASTGQSEQTPTGSERDVRRDTP